MIRFLSTVGVVALVMNSGLTLSPAGPPQTQVDSAFAEFLINPTGHTETHVVVFVTQTKSLTTVDFLYDVQSTSEVGDFLFYHSITDRSDSINKRDFKVQADGKKAVLNT